MSENQIEQPTECVIKAQSSPSPTLRYNHRINYKGLTILARDMSSAELKGVKTQVKKFIHLGREIQSEQSKLQREGDRLEREIARLKIELSHVEKLTSEREEVIESRLDAIQLRQGEIVDALQQVGDKQESFMDQQFQVMTDVVKTHVVGAEWLEGEEKKFTEVVEFESRKAESDVGQIIMELSALTRSEADHLNGR